MSSDVSPTANVSKTQGNNKSHSSKTYKELKFSDKDEVYTTETMYACPESRGDEYRDSGCFDEDNDHLPSGDGASSKKSVGAGSPPNSGKISSKTLEKRAAQLQKRAATHKPRQHSKSCSVAVDEENDQSEYSRVVQHLQNSSGISDARISTSNHNHRGKKVGAGLRWGRPGDELSADIHTALDENDPNYDSELENPASLKMVVTPVSQKDYERLLTAWVDEYFDHGDVHEVCALLRELAPTKAQLVQLPLLVMSMALERKPRHRELSSQLLSAVCDRGLLNHTLMEEAFNLVLTDTTLRELTVDVPEAPEMIGCFIARAVADDVIPPKFVESYKGRVNSDQVLQALRKAENLLHIPHAYAHLDVVWMASGLRNSSDGRPTKQLSRAFSLLVKEYVDAREKREVSRTLRELDAPHFLHELVVQAVLVVVERSTEEATQVVVDLLGYLHSTGECSGSMLEQGIRRVYAMLPDISLDVPSAYLIMDRFIRQAHERGFISTALVKEMPRKKRSRFISECVTRPGKSSVPIL